VSRIAVSMFTCAARAIPRKPRRDFGIKSQKPGEIDFRDVTTDEFVQSAGVAAVYPFHGGRELSSASCVLLNMHTMVWNAARVGS